MPVASFSGLASGIDTASLVTGLVGVARQPITRLQKQQATLNQQAARVDDLRTKLSAFRRAAQALNSTTEVLATTATSADTSVVKVTGSASASASAYDVRVTSLAKSTRAYADPVAAKDQTGLFGTGTLALTIGGTTTNVTVDASDTLASVAGKINDADIEAVAGLFFDGTSWRLSVNGTETGAAKAVGIVESGGLTLGLSNPANLNQAAADAVFEIDGFPVTSASNTVTSAISGLTLELVKPSPSPAATTIQIERDPSSLETKVNEFVKTYNDVMNAIDAEVPKDGAVRAGSLAGDPTLRSIQSRLRGLVGQQVSGLSGNYKTLSSVGISLSRTGAMSVNTSKLSSAANADPAAVAALFAAEGTATGVMRSIDSVVEGYVTAGSGVLSTKSKGIRDRANSISERIDGMELRVTKYEDTLKKQFTSLEMLVSGLNAQGNQLAAVTRNL
jgi:flagellar hook-associated protein 2